MAEVVLWQKNYGYLSGAQLKLIGGEDLMNVTAHGPLWLLEGLLEKFYPQIILTITTETSVMPDWDRESRGRTFDR